MALAIPLIVLLTLLVGYGIVGNARPASGGFVSWLTKTLETASGIGFVTAKAALDLTQRLSHALGIHYDALVNSGVRWVATLANYVNVVGYWTLYWPVELLHVVSWLVKSHIPHAINARTAPIAKTAANAEAQAKAAAGTAHSTTKVVKGHSTVKEVTTIQHVAMPHAKHWDWINTHWKSLTHAISNAASVALPVPYGLTIKNIKARLRALEKATPAALGIGAVVLAIGRLGLGFIRCGNVKKTGKAICGINPGLLEELLAVGLTIASVVSVVEFTKELQTIEKEAFGIIDHMVREWPTAPLSPKA